MRTEADVILLRVVAVIYDNASVAAHACTEAIATAVVASAEGYAVTLHETSLVEQILGAVEMIKLRCGVLYAKLGGE